MRLRFATMLFAGAIFAACGGDTGETAAGEADEAPPTDVASGDEAALEEFRAYYVEHYNMGHGDMVADLYTDSAVALMADGSVDMGNDAIRAGLNAAMANSPELSVETAETKLFGDYAVTRGSYGVTMTPEGAEAMSVSGQFMAGFQRDGDGWKMGFLLTNYDSDPPEGLPPAEAGDPPPDMMDSPGSELVAFYEEHFNMGHGSMVAERYAENAAAAFANLPLAEGRAAIQATLDERIAMGSPQLTIHTVGVQEYGEGWFAEGGWYELTATGDEGTVNQVGNWVILCSTAEDGTAQIEWAVTNGHVQDEM